MMNFVIILVENTPHVLHCRCWEMKTIIDASCMQSNRCLLRCPPRRMIHPKLSVSDILTRSTNSRIALIVCSCSHDVGYIAVPGGPKIDMKYGRKDATSPQCCVDEGNLPAGNAPFPDADTPQVSQAFTSSYVLRRTEGSVSQDTVVCVA